MASILSLCDGTGAWSDPYRQAGYDVDAIDIRSGKDVRLIELPHKRYHGILAAPPCTVFALSGVSWPRSDKERIQGISVVDACLRIIFCMRPAWWALENPVGILKRYIGEPVLRFHPCDYGDPYTKYTCIWGQFAIPKRNRVKPTEGSLMHRIRDPKLRSVTPPGFARAFFDANP
jgi:site-specific DNA-cytosine methylase